MTPRLRTDERGTADENPEVEAEETEMDADKGLVAEMRKEDTRESPVKKIGGVGLEAETEERDEDPKNTLTNCLCIILKYIPYCCT